LNVYKASIQCEGVQVLLTSHNFVDVFESILDVLALDGITLKVEKIK
jgi:hypothetical protein